jgi:hypothetical protein
MSDRLFPDASVNVKVSATGRGFRNAGGLDEQVIKPSFPRQLSDFHEQVFPQRTADAAVRHFDELFLDPVERGSTLGDELCVYVDLAHVIDDDSHALSFAILQDVVEQGGFPGSKETRQHGNG